VLNGTDRLLSLYHGLKSQDKSGVITLIARMRLMRVLALMLLMAAAAVAQAQTTNQSPQALQTAAVATGNGTAIPVNNAPSITVAVTGSIGGGSTITFETTLDPLGSTGWTATMATALVDFTQATTATALGQYNVITMGTLWLRARISTYGTGTITAMAMLVMDGWLAKKAAAGGGGTVTSVSVVTANGVSGSVATPTTTPAITLTLGAILPTTVNGLTITSSTGTFTLANAKVLTVNKTMTLTAADDTGSYTLPTGTHSIAPLDAPIFTGQPTIADFTLSTHSHLNAAGGGLLTPTAAGLANVTNDAQTKAAIVPNTVPSAGQILAGNAGGTAYAPVTLSGSGATFTLSSAGVLTVSAIPNISLSNSSVTVGTTAIALGASSTVLAGLTSVTDPLLIGGTAVGSNAEIRSTSAVGTTDFIKFTVGNAGGTEAMRIFDSGGVSVGTTVDPGVGIFNVLTGFRINNAATTKFVPRGNGTNFIAAQLACGDLSDSGAGCTGAAGANPAGSGSEIQARSNATTFQAVTGSSTASGGIALVQGATGAIPLAIQTIASSTVAGFQLSNHSAQPTAFFQTVTDGGQATTSITGTADIAVGIAGTTQLGFRLVETATGNRRTMFFGIDNNWGYLAAFGALAVAFDNNSRIKLLSTGLYGFGSTGTLTDTTFDAAMGRNGVNQVQVNNGTAGQWGSLFDGVRDGGTMTVTAGTTSGHQSTGTPAAGFGTSHQFNANDSTTADVAQGSFYTAWETATHASRRSWAGVQAISHLQTQIDTGIFNATLEPANNTVTTASSITLASNSGVGVVLQYGVEVFNGTDVQFETGMAACHVVNKGGVFTQGGTNGCTKFGNQQTMTSGTLAVTWTMTGANPSLLQVNANSSLTPNAGYPRVTYALVNVGSQSVSVQ
jgi:hypothetical protein